MGSKLHQINKFFTSLQKNKCYVIAVGLKTSGVNQLKVSMDRESVRNTMLKHQEIFNQQVYELHRLYRVQKMLMAELRNKEANLHSCPSEAGTTAAVADTRTRIWSSASTSDTSHSSHVSNVQPTKAGLSSRELSICSWDRSSVFAKGIDLEQPTEECSSKGKELKETSSEVPLSWPDEESEIELTLTIGRGPNKKKQTDSQRRNTEIGFSDATTSGSTRSFVSSRPILGQK